MQTKNVLLHICCGVCSSRPVQKLREDGYQVTGYFYNPNIHPEEEYSKRLEVAKKVSEILEFELIAGEHDKDKWLKECEEFRNEPEGGKRCAVCFRMRLEETSRKAKELGAESFTSTLTVSPHKNSKLINETGHAIGQEAFLQYDFKKKDGFKKTQEFAKKNLLYCQHYCGCEFSDHPK